MSSPSGHFDSIPYRLQCWVCDHASASQIKAGLSPEALTPDHFAITDAHYGMTLSLYRCDSCGFLFCPDAGDVTRFYSALSDDEYERTRSWRCMQARHLLKKISSYKTSGVLSPFLLDVGAGSGILVEEAQKMGYQASGIEPSASLVAQAKKHGLPVLPGIFPDASPRASYDVITLIDVLEHVNMPVALLRSMAAYLEKDGIAIVVTPDVASLAARLLGEKWWHYRIAHIGYFNRKTLKKALEKAGLEPIAWHRPTWFFPLDYVLLRLGHYLPLIGRLAGIPVTHSIPLPLNLFDSWMVIARKIA
jgi:SAM-dependent methyltransferase